MDVSDVLCLVFDYMDESSQLRLLNSTNQSIPNIKYINFINQSISIDQFIRLNKKYYIFSLSLLLDKCRAYLSSNIDNIPTCNTLQTLHLSNTNVLFLQKIFVSFPKLCKITLYNIDDLQIRYVSLIPNLDTLLIENCILIDSSIDELKKSTELRSLSLTESKLKIEDYHDDEQLYPNHHYRFIIDSDLQFLESYLMIQTLDLSNTSFTDISLLRNCLQLHTLRIDRTYVTSLEPIRHLTDIKELSFHNSDMKNIQAILDFPQLESLNASYSPIDNLNVIFDCTNLSIIILSAAQINEMQHFQSQNVFLYCD